MGEKERKGYVRWYEALNMTKAEVRLCQFQQQKQLWDQTNKVSKMKVQSSYFFFEAKVLIGNNGLAQNLATLSSLNKTNG